MMLWDVYVVSLQVRRIRKRNPCWRGLDDNEVLSRSSGQGEGAGYIGQTTDRKVLPQPDDKHVPATQSSTIARARRALSFSTVATRSIRFTSAIAAVFSLDGVLRNQAAADRGCGHSTGPLLARATHTCCHGSWFLVLGISAAAMVRSRTAFYELARPGNCPEDQRTASIWKRRLKWRWELRRASLLVLLRFVILSLPDWVCRASIVPTPASENRGRPAVEAAWIGYRWDPRPRACQRLTLQITVGKCRQRFWISHASVASVRQHFTRLCWPCFSRVAAVALGET
ncbi:hypothetical protein F4802DRAFT_285045 [Xylaria palmicola]|nr:hypothetical protein F4802DRAFT_285045 [Xylaria palmicola]